MTDALTIINDLLSVIWPELTDTELEVMSTSALQSRARQAAAVLAAREFVAGEGRGDEASAAEAMREAAAEEAQKIADGDKECLDQVPNDILRHYHSGGRDAAEMCVRLIRALPLPSPTPDRRLEAMREAAIGRLRSLRLPLPSNAFDRGRNAALVDAEESILALLDAAMNPEETK